MHIIVTGGAGFIGSNLVNSLTCDRHTVLVIDNLCSGDLSRLKCSKLKYAEDSACPGEIKQLSSKLFFLNANLLVEDLNALLLRWFTYIDKPVDWFIHLAAHPQLQSPSADQNISVLSYNLAIDNRVHELVSSFSKSSAVGCIKHFLYTSDSVAFDQGRQSLRKANRRLLEKDLYATALESGKGWSKLIGHVLTAYLEKITKIPSYTIILHSVYGQNCNYTTPSSNNLGYLLYSSYFLRSKKAAAIECCDFADLKSDLLHVDDVIRGVRELLVYKPLKHRVIQLCSGTSYSSSTVLAVVSKVIFDKTQKTVCYTERVLDRVQRAGNRKLAKTLFKWQPEISLEQGVEMLFDWIKEDFAKKTDILDADNC